MHMKRIFACIAMLLALTLALAACAQPASAPAPEADAEMQSRISQLESDLSAANAERDRLSQENKSLSDSVAQLEADKQKLSDENAVLAGKVEAAAPWFALSELEQQKETERLQAEQAAQEQAEREAQEQAAKEAAEKEKKGYETGITYAQLSRTPDDFEGEKVKFKGRVLQVIEGDSEVQLRVATKGNWDNVIFVYYPSNLVASRVLEDDKITIYGVSKGLFSYDSTGSGKITIPLIQVDKIDQ